MPCLAIPWQLGCEGNAQFFQRRCQRLQLRARAAVRTCATEDRQGAEHEDRHDGEKESSRGAPKATVSSNDLKGPTFQDGVDAYCWWLIGLLFLTDYTPVGAAVASSSQPLLYTAAIQVLLFAAPTVVGSISRGEEIRSVYRVRGCTPGQLIASAGAGVALYAVITAAEQARDGVKTMSGLLLSSPGAQDAAQATATVLGGASLPLTLAMAAVVGPLAEEVMFRGFLLSALQKKLGKWDSLAASGFAFAVIHLDPGALLRFTALGTAAGFAATATDSLLPAVVLHSAHNVVAIVSQSYLK